MAKNQLYPQSIEVSFVVYSGLEAAPEESVAIDYQLTYPESNSTTSVRVHLFVVVVSLQSINFEG